MQNPRTLRNPSGRALRGTILKGASSAAAAPPANQGAPAASAPAAVEALAEKLNRHYDTEVGAPFLHGELQPLSLYT